MRAIRRFTVRTVLPAPIAALGELASNLRWSWHPPTRDLFASVDPAGWDAARHDPVALLAAQSHEQLDVLAADGAFVARVQGAAADLAAYLSEPLWYQQKIGAERPGGASPTSRPSSASPPCCPSTPAAWASWPVTTSSRPPTWACRSSGSACSTRPATSSSRCRATAGSWSPTPCSTPTSCPSRCCARPTAARPGSAWGCPAAVSCTPTSGRPRSGRVPLLLLDCLVEENDEAARGITDRLYGGGGDHRLQQEMLLGIGGVAGPAGVVATDRRRGARGLPHQRGPRRVPGPGADPGARGRGPRLRRCAREGPGRNGLHHPHPGAGRHRPVRPRPDRGRLRRRQRRSRRPGRAGARAGRRGLRRWRPQRLQHGRDGPAARSARQRRQQAARRRQPRDVRGAVAGLRPRRGADQLDHQRGARSDLGRPSGGRPGREVHRRRHRRPRQGLGVDRLGAGRRDLGHPARHARRPGDRGPAPGALVLAQAGRQPGRARLGRRRARPGRAHHRVRPPGAHLQAAHADAARARPAQEAAAATPTGPSSW